MLPRGTATAMATVWLEPPPLGAGAGAGAGTGAGDGGEADGTAEMTCAAGHGQRLRYSLLILIKRHWVPWV